MRTTIDIPDDASHRSYRDIVAMIEGADLPASVAKRSLETFHVLAVAEGKIHGVPTDDVHFHEVGAVDAIGVAGCWWRPPAYWTRSPWAGKRILNGRPVVDGALLGAGPPTVAQAATPGTPALPTSFGRPIRPAAKTPTSIPSRS